MSVQTRQRVGLKDVGKGVLGLLPDLPGLAKQGPGLLLRKPTDAMSLGLVFQQAAAKHPERPFLADVDHRYTYGEANDLVNQYAGVLAARGVKRGDVVGLLAQNEAQTVLCMLATVKLGAIAGLLNYNQRHDVMAHSLGILDARAILVADDCLDVLESVPGGVDPDLVLPFSELDKLATGRATDDPTVTTELTGQDKAFYIFTSGTTGMPKASIMSHYRWLKSFSGLGALGVRLRGDDVLYCPLPLYHNNAVTVALGAVLAGGASFAVGRKFSASRFWEDCDRFGATAFVYIGELCRYLLRQPAKPDDARHGIRVIVGNGLRQDIWTEFQERFAIGRIAEFYGASECNIAFINAFGISETAGSCPLPHKVVEYDQATGKAKRNAKGRLVQVKTGEVGLLLAKVTERQPFDGYTDAAATEKKLLRDGFKDGDCWFDTGDLVRKQGHLHVAFVDRLGDTFRWKGENVATTQVEAAVGRADQVEDCTVYGVEVPGADGRAGMATVVLKEGVDFDGKALGDSLYDSLPPYALPLFVRVVGSLETTSTFKSRKVSLRDQGYDTFDPVFVLKGRDEGYVRYYDEYPAEVAAAKAPR